MLSALSIKYTGAIKAAAVANIASHSFQASLLTCISEFSLLLRNQLIAVYSLSAIFAMFCLSKSVYLYPIYQIISDGIYVVQSYFNGLYGSHSVP